MPYPMNVATGQSGSVPKVRRRTPAAAQVFLAGAVVVKNAPGEVIEAASGAVLISGVALQGVDTGLGYGVQNAAQITVATGRDNQVSIAEANKDTEFRAVLVGAANAEVLPTLAHMDKQYGIIKRPDGTFAIDSTNAVNLAVQVVDIAPELGNIVIFKWLPAVIGGL